MAIFISKEELLGSPAKTEIVKEVGGYMPPTSPIPDLQGGDFLDKLERVLARIDNVVSTAERIRSNPMIKAATSKPPSQALPDAPVLSKPPPAEPKIQPATPAPAPEAKPQEVEFNPEGAKEALASLFGELDKKDENVKAITLGQLLSDYKSPLKKPFIESLILGQLNDNFPKLVKWKA